jgi:hypothetical protein
MSSPVEGTIGMRTPVRMRGPAFERSGLGHRVVGLQNIGTAAKSNTVATASWARVLRQRSSIRLGDAVDARECAARVQALVVDGPTETGTQ